ncbi:MAG: hypothetical protein Q4D71_06935 [Oscillospiraceae bacterium]|nr:hypothetical protein [Oscillospiraceae bacterium]
MNHFTGKKKYLLGALFITFMLYFAFSISGHIYTYTDNITVALVTAGYYGDNNMCQYLHPLFCLIIKVLNPVLPTADVFAVLMHGFLLLGIYFVSYAAIETSFRQPLKQWGVEEYISRSCLLLAIVYFTLGLKLFGINYTVQTGAIIATGVMVLFYAFHTNKGKSWITVGTILIFAGFLGRVEACLLALPFMALELFIEFVRNKERLDWIRKTVGYILPSIIVIAALLGSKVIFLSTEPYRSDAAYNKYRTIMGDYPAETYGVTYKDWEGIDRDIYNAVIHWNLSDTDKINTEMLRKIAETGSRNAFLSNKEGLKRTLREMKRQSTTIDVHVMTLLALAVILTLWCVFTVKRIWLKIEALFSFLGGFIILFYFTFRGRAPLRVWQCVLIDALTILVLVMVKDGMERTQMSSLEEQRVNVDANGAIEKEKPVLKKSRAFRTATVVFQLFLCVVLYFGVGQVMAHSGIHKPITPLTSKIGADDSVYEDTFKDNTLYIWPWWHAAVPDHFALQDKLPTRRVIEHNIGMGDWVYEQVYFRNYLERIGASNPALALLDRENTYLVEGMEEDFLIYMKHYYGEDIELEEVGEIREKKVFKMVRTGKTTEAEYSPEDAENE